MCDDKDLSIVHPEPVEGGTIKIEMYTTTYCNYCKMAKTLLKEKGLPFTEIDVTGDDEKRNWLVETTGRKTVPQIFIDGKPIGGYTDLVAWFQNG